MSKNEKGEKKVRDYSSQVLNAKNAFLSAGRDLGKAAKAANQNGEKDAAKALDSIGTQAISLFSELAKIGE